MEALLKLLKTTLSGIKWPVLKLTELTNASSQELGLVAIIILMLFTAGSFIKLVGGLALAIIVLTLVIRWFNSQKS